MEGGKRKERKRTHNAIKYQRQKLLRTRNILQREKKKEKNTFLPLFLSKSRRKIGMKNGEGKIREREKERERACVRVRVRYRPGGRQCFDNGARLTESTARRGWRSERAVGPRVHAGNRNKWWRGASCTSHREPVTPRCLRTRSARVE